MGNVTSQEWALCSHCLETPLLFLIVDAARKCITLKGTQRFCDVVSMILVAGAVSYVLWVTYFVILQCWMGSWAARLPLVVLFFAAQDKGHRLQSRRKWSAPGFMFTFTLLLTCCARVDAVATRRMDYGSSQAVAEHSQLVPTNLSASDHALHAEIVKELADLEDSKANEVSVRRIRDPDTGQANVRQKDVDHTEDLEGWRDDMHAKVADLGADPFRLSVLNVDGLYNTGAWATNFKIDAADLAILTETKLGQQVLLTEGYTALQSMGPDNSTKGGVAIMVRNELLSEIRVVDQGIWNQLWVSVPSRWFGKADPGRRTLLGALYVAPISSKQKRKFFQKYKKTSWCPIQDMIAKHASGGRMDVVLAGDLNTYTDTYVGCPVATDGRWQLVTGEQAEFADWCEQAQDWSRESVCNGNPSRSP